MEDKVRVLKHTRKNLMLLEAGFIWCLRRGIEYSDDTFIDDYFMSDDFQSDLSDEFDNICTDLRRFRFCYKNYDLKEITVEEYEKCIDEFGSE